MTVHETVHVELQIVHQHILGITRVHSAPGDEIHLHRLGNLEEYLQYRNQHHKREYVQHSRQQCEQYRQYQILSVGRNKPPQDLKKFLHTPKPFVSCINIPGKGTLFLLYKWYEYRYLIHYKLVIIKKQHPICCRLYKKPLLSPPQKQRDKKWEERNFHNARLTSYASCLAARCVQTEHSRRWCATPCALFSSSIYPISTYKARLSGRPTLTNACAAAEYTSLTTPQ